MANLGDVRKNYYKDVLFLGALSADPMIQFERWYQDAERIKLKEPNAMTLATVSANGQPSARIVLLKGFDKTGFTFYTNYVSKKGQDIAANPQVGLCFLWKDLERQVRIEGVAEKVDEEVSKGYFNSRPRGSQISAWASPQSQEINEEYLDDKRKLVEDQFADKETIPLPPHWGGYTVKPSRIEFWQGRSNRYHDRFKYQLSDSGNWKIVRLAP